jgi:hypothetical protein
LQVLGRPAEVAAKAVVASVYIGYPEIEDEDVATILGGIEIVNGSLLIENAYLLTTLSLPNLQSVGTEFGVLENIGLEQVDVPGLTSVGQQVRVQGNTKLVDLDFANLVQIGTSATSTAGVLSVQKNTLLEAMSFASLKTVDQITVYWNYKLKAAAFPSLEGSLHKGIALHRNDQLTSLDLGGVKEVLGGISVNHHNLLLEISAVLLEYVGVGGLSLYQLPKLNLLLAPALAEVAGLLNIGDNTGLTDLCSTNLTADGVTEITVGTGSRLHQGDATLLVRADVYPIVPCAAEGSMVIRSEADYVRYLGDATHMAKTELTSVLVAWDGLTSSQLVALLGRVEAINASLIIEDCGNITSANLTSLTSVGGAMVLSRNEQLRSVNLGAMDSAGRFEVHGNPVLASLQTPGLVQVDGLLSINSNPKLTELDVEQVQQIGDLSIGSMAGLTTLAFSSLVGSTRRSVSIRDNVAMQSVALGGLTEVKGGLLFHNMHALENISMVGMERVLGRLQFSDMNRLTNVLAPALLSVKELTFHQLKALVQICMFGAKELAILHGAPRGLWG